MKKLLFFLLLLSFLLSYVINTNLVSISVSYIKLADMIEEFDLDETRESDGQYLQCLEELLNSFISIEWHDVLYLDESQIQRDSSMYVSLVNMQNAYKNDNMAMMDLYGARVYIFIDLEKKKNKRPPD